MSTEQETLLVQSAPRELAEPSARAVARLVELNIQFVAIDFDCTILDIHTGGNWKYKLEQLLPHVRPLFTVLIREVLQQNIQVGIVTFSTQVDLVRGLLERMVGQDKADRVVIRGGYNGITSGWAYHGAGARNGKQPHMASAAEELEAIHKVEITKQSTLLIDDDIKNVQIALKEGVRAIWLNPNKSHLLLNDIEKLV